MTNPFIHQVTVVPGRGVDDRRPLHGSKGLLLYGPSSGWQQIYGPGVILLYRLVYFVVATASVTKTKKNGARLLPVRPLLNSSVTFLIKPHRTRQTQHPPAAYLQSAASLGALQPSSTYGSTGGPSLGPLATYVEVWTVACRMTSLDAPTSKIPNKCNPEDVGRGCRCPASHLCSPRPLQPSRRPPLPMALTPPPTIGALRSSYT